MKTGESMRVFLLGVAVALLAVAVFRPATGTAQAQMAVAPPSNSSLIALTAAGSDKEITLFLIDPVKMTIAYYTAKSNQPFSLRQVRWFKNDLSIFRTGDNEKGNKYEGGGISVKDAEKLAKEGAR